MTFGFVLREPDMAGLKADCSRHDQDVYTDDCIELFLDVEGRRSASYQIVANARGAIYDGTAADRGWDAVGTKAVAHAGKQEWTLEVFVPFADFPERPQVKIGSVWFANFCRSRYRESHELQRWSTLKRYTNLDFSAFGKL